MNLTVIKAAFALHALVLGATAAHAQAVPKTTTTTAQADQQQVEQQATGLQAAVQQAAKAHKLKQPAADALYKELAGVKASVKELAPKQGFVSAAEKASYQRVFAKAERAIAGQQ
jgi:hypothetical protein